MDGKLINDINEDRIRSFLQDNKPMDSWHIDEILSFKPSKSQWIKVAFECFYAIHSFVIQHEEISVELCFFLNRTKNHRPMPKQLNRHFFNNIDTPPEIFLIRSMPDIINCNGVKKECGILYGLNCEYYEIRDEMDNIYWHYLYLTNSTSNIIALKNILNQIN